MATAPLRKCIAAVAGTPAIDSPSACVITSFPSTVTRRMTALRWSLAMISRARWTIVAACAPPVLGACKDRDGSVCADTRVHEAAVTAATREPASRRRRPICPGRYSRSLPFTGRGSLPAQRFNHLRFCLLVSLQVFIGGERRSPASRLRRDRTRCTMAAAVPEA